MPDVDFNYFLGRKYALLAQNADATTSNAASAAIQANAQQTAAEAAAQLDRTRATLLPAESKSQIGLQGQQARVFGAQADLIPVEGAARVGQIKADTALTTTNNSVLTRERLTPFSKLFGSNGLPSLNGTRLPVADSPLPRKLPGESEANYMDRINGVGAYAR